MDSLEKLPPQALDMEANVLGAMLIDCEAAGVAVEILRPEDFYKGSHRRIFEVARELYDHEQALDLNLLRQALADQGALEEVGGAGYLADLAAAVATSAHVEQYALHVREKSRLRQLIAAATQIVRSGFEPGATADELLAQADAALMGLAGDHDTGGADAAQLADELIKQLQGPGLTLGLQSGLPLLDENLGGLRPGELIIVAARPNVGKTTLALNVLTAVASGGVPVLFFSLEMNRQTIAKHLVRQRTGLDLFSGPLNANAEHLAIDAALDLRKLPFTVEDGSLNLADIRSRTRRAVTKGRCGLVVIDYLQRIQTPADADNRCQAIGAIGRGLKSLAVDAAVPVLALCQLNRESEKREDRRPRLSDLRDSGELEQEADAVILLHRPNKEKPFGQGGDDGLMVMDLAKSRNTAVGDAATWIDLATGVIHPSELARNTAQADRQTLGIRSSGH